MEEFYEKVQYVVDEIPRGDVLYGMYVIGDWNAKVGQEETNGTTGRFGLGERNERGDQLVEFCSRTLSSSYMHGGCTHGDRRTKPPEIRSITSYAKRDGEVV